jgi:hypothetical protein
MPGLPLVAGDPANTRAKPVVVVDRDGNLAGAGGEYETAAAGVTDQALGATGAAGDYLEGLLCIVSTAATAQVQIKDGNGSAITVFPNNPGAGVGSFYLPIKARSLAGAWKVTTGAGVAVFATGNFT